MKWAFCWEAIVKIIIKGQKVYIVHCYIITRLIFCNQKASIQQCSSIEPGIQKQYQLIILLHIFSNILQCTILHQRIQLSYKPVKVDLVDNIYMKCDVLFV